jgi:hypothetical protein
MKRDTLTDEQLRVTIDYYRERLRETTSQDRIQRAKRNIERAERELKARGAAAPCAAGPARAFCEGRP